jgi:hypothetical protein
MVRFKALQLFATFSVATKLTSPPGRGGQLKSNFADEFSASSWEMLLIGESDPAGSEIKLFF